MRVPCMIGVSEGRSAFSPCYILAKHTLFDKSPPFSAVMYAALEGDNGRPADSGGDESRR